MAILALDIGDSRTGIALAHDNSQVVIPLRSINTPQELKGKSELAKLIRDHEVTFIVVGLPLSLDGEEHSQARHIRNLARKLLTVAGWVNNPEELSDETRIRFFDERLSTKEAESRLSRYGKSSKESRDYADALAAAVILENYLQLKESEHG